jgi:hypothetical protein
MLVEVGLRYRVAGEIEEFVEEVEEVEVAR